MIALQYVIRTVVRVEGYIATLISHAESAESKSNTGRVRGLHIRPNCLKVLKEARTHLRAQFDTRIIHVLQVSNIQYKAHGRCAC